MFSTSKRLAALFVALLLFSLVILPNSVLAKTSEASSVLSGGFNTSSAKGVPLDKQVAVVRDITAKSNCVETLNNVTSACPEGSVFAAEYMSEQSAKAANLPYAKMTMDPVKNGLAIDALFDQETVKHLASHKPAKSVVTPMLRGCGGDQNYNNAWTTGWYANVRWAIGFNVYTGAGGPCGDMQIFNDYAGFDNNAASNPQTYWGGLESDRQPDTGVCLSMPRNDNGINTYATNGGNGYVKVKFKQSCNNPFAGVEQRTYYTSGF